MQPLFWGHSLSFTQTDISNKQKQSQSQQQQQRRINKYLIINKDRANQRSSRRLRYKFQRCYLKVLNIFWKQLQCKNEIAIRAKERTVRTDSRLRILSIVKELRAHDCKYRESLARLKKSKILIICQKNPFGELSSKKIFSTFKNL